MAEPFLGEIRMFGGNFAPRGWAFCSGQLLAVPQNDALFALLGTIYGGDGRTTFGLPDLRGRLPIHFGSGPGLTPRPIGSRGGSERVTPTQGQLPAHSHTFQASTQSSDSSHPDDRVLSESTLDMYAPPSDGPAVNMAGPAISNLGGGQAHNNLMPFLCVNFIIALVGIFPSRS